MKINVKSLQGDEYHVEIGNNQLVSELKALISEKANGLTVARQKLVFKGRTMQDTSVVGEYNLEEGCKVHLIVQKETTATNPTTADAAAATTTSPNNNSQPSSTTTNTSSIKSSDATTTTATTSTASNQTNKQSRFEVILRERLAKHFAPNAVEKIMVNLHDEINADINSSSLDDLERLAKQKLNISNE